MSDNKTISSAENFIYTRNPDPMPSRKVVEMLLNDFARLHLEAMREEIDTDLMMLEDRIKGKDGDLITEYLYQK